MLKQSVLILAMALALGACTTKKLDSAPVGDASTSGAQGAGSGANGAGQSSVTGIDASQSASNTAGPQGVSQVVYFDFDSFVVRASDRQVVEAHARFLQANKNRRVTLEGNTDERGGREYNLALGQKRAEAVRRSLNLLGVGDGQIEAISYGEEKPAATGASEDAYSQNRRVEFKYQ
jgi:peptidoglycan-associated lipoprotein